MTRSPFNQTDVCSPYGVFSDQGAFDEGALIYMCSGQGSQKPGMGVDVLDLPEVARSFASASEAFGRDVRSVVTNASAEELTDTVNAQAAISALSIGIGRALMARGIEPAVLLGFSLGQLSAMALGDMLSDEAAFKLIAVRARLMGEAATHSPGVMSALLKGDSEAVEALCEECAQGEVLVPANYNCPGQTVIAGSTAAIERAELAWKERGGRVSRLATQGAFHSPLMASAAEAFQDHLATVDFAEARIPVISNLDARPLKAAEARRALADHLTHPVRFEQSIVLLRDAGARRFVEIGYGGVLSGLIRRIDRDLERDCIQDRASFDRFCAAQAASAGRQAEEVAPKEEING